MPIAAIGVMAAFGCNYAGDISPAQVVGTVADGLAIAAKPAPRSRDVSLADTMGWATPAASSARSARCATRWPDLRIALHLHDTRGLGVANALCRAAPRRDRVRCHRGGARRLPVRRPERRGRQHLHRGAGAAVRGDGHRDRRRSRRADRGRPPGRADRRPPPAERALRSGTPAAIPAQGLRDVGVQRRWPD